MTETTSRALALLNLLQTHRTWAGPELARRLEVTDRTLRRDIDRLRELGYQIEATRGLAGGYRLESGTRMPPLLLTDDEAVTVAIGLRLAANHGLADGEQTTLSALAKFEQVLPSALRRRVNAMGAYLSPQSPRGGAVSPELLGQLALACRDQERVRFRYTAANGEESSRLVEPSAVAAVERVWYLVCWDLDRADWRTFRIDRMSQFSGTATRFQQRELPAATGAEYVRQSLGATRPKRRAVVILRMSLTDAREHFGSWGRELEAVDGDHVRWPIYGDTWETLISSLVWIPPGVEYELEGDRAFLAFGMELSGRLHHALTGFVS